MKRSVLFLLVTTIFVSTASTAFAWGDEGHQTVGKIASLRIKPRTAQKIAEILKPGETLASIATWADSVKERVGKTDPDPDTNAFLQDVVHNEKNREWHYDDLALNCKNYQTCTGFTPDNDIVHMLNVCIRTLQGHPDANHPLTKRNALRLIVHFLGDLHQPLHVGCGYIDVNGPNHTIVIVRDPAIIRREHLPSDKGANDLVIDGDRSNLHSFWDFTLVTSLMNAVGQELTSESLGTFLQQHVKPKASWNPHGPIAGWAAEWATDSLRQSRDHTYQSVKITGQRRIPVLSHGEPVVKDGQPVMQTVFDITRAPNYEAVNRELVRQQLAKAGYRLAKLLDAIFAGANNRNVSKQ
ncbi:MAG TPA: S1/P1 nuclease [Pyrinomonadaceae bacterium]|nr:S1/P1 nuclease [Pyrinomonadaceae bacterium]